MTTNTISQSKSRTVLIAAFVWAIIYIGALFLIKKVDLITGFKIGLAFAPLLPFVVFLTAYVKANKVDELHWQIQLQAAAIAFFLTLLVLMTLGLLSLVIPLSEGDFSLRHIWQYCILFYFLGLAIAWRKYKA